MKFLKKTIFLFLFLMTANIMSISFLTIFTGGLFLISKAAEAGRADWCFLLTLLMIIVFVRIRHILNAFLDRLSSQKC